MQHPCAGSRRRHARRALGHLAVITGLYAPGPSVLAQAADPPSGAQPAQLAPIQVTGQSDAGQAPTLTRLPIPIKDIPQSVTVITRERMQEQGLINLDEVLQASPGITVQPYQGLTTAYYARGFKIDSFQQDGVSTLMGQTASAPQDMAVYERVELLRGANGLLQGSGNPAATVNLVRKRPQKKFEASGSLNAGSWQRYRGEVDVGGPLNASGSLRGRIVAAHEDRGYFYDVARQKSTTLYGIAELDLTADTTLGAGVHYQRIDSIPNMAGVPFYADGTDIGLPRDAYHDTDWGRFDWKALRLFADLRHRLNADWSIKGSIEHYQVDADIKYAGLNGAIDPIKRSGARLTGGAYRVEQSQDSFDLHLSGAFAGWGRRHEVLVGANGHVSRNEMWSATLNSPHLNQPFDIFSWDPDRIPDPGTSAYASPGETRIRQHGVYAMGRFALTDRIKIILGSRLSWWHQTTPTATQKHHSVWTPYGGVVVALTPQWSAYASYTDIFQPQAERTTSGTPIDPITGANREIGLKGELADGRLNVSLAAFDILQSNRAVQDPSAPCVGRTCYYVNGGKVRSRGFEAEVAGQVTPHWSVYAGYTYNTTKYLRDPVAAGQPFSSFTPRHMLRLWTHYRLPVLERRLSVGAGLRVQSGFHRTSGTVTQRQGGYATVDLSLGYRVNSHLQATLQVNNVFDRRYYQELFGTAWSNRYGEPRSVMLNLRMEY